MSDETPSVDRSSGRDYLRLLARLGLFGAPILAFCAFPVWLLDHMGELRCIDTAEIARSQVSGQELLYGPAYSDCTQHLKMQGTIAAKAEVLVLGTSRATQVRSEFFRTSFYNASGAAPRAVDLRAILERIPREGQPRLIVVMLDQFFFNVETDRHIGAEYRPTAEALTSCTSRAEFIGSMWTRTYRDLLARKIPPSLVVQGARDGRLGVRANVLGAGYRRDGSHRLAGRESFDDVRDRMAKGLRRFEPGTEVASEMIAEVERFLDIARGRGIDVIAILPPYAPTIFGELRAGGRWSYFDKVHPAIAPRFAARGHAVYDHTDPARAALTDDAFYDGFHLTEGGFARVLLAVAKEDERLRAVLDVEGLERMLEKATDPFAIVTR